MKKMHRYGVVAGCIAWFIFCVFQSGEASCVRLGRCDRGDLIVFCVVGIGMMAPAYVVALLVSTYFDDHD